MRRFGEGERVTLHLVAIVMRTADGNIVTAKRGGGNEGRSQQGTG